MKPDQTAPQTIDEYIAGFPEDVQARLEQIRRTIRDAAPDAEETIKYDMPTFMLNGNLIYFAVFKKHIGVYPRTAGMDELKAELAPYEGAKSAIRFPLDQPIPYDLLTKMVKVRVAENAAKPEAKGKKKH